MCRNIKTLYNFEPEVSQDELRAAALQYVRKISGFQKPSKVNEEIFERAVVDIAQVTRELLTSLQTTAPKRNREQEAQKLKAANQKHFA